MFETYTEVMLTIIAALLGGLTSIGWSIYGVLLQIRDKRSK